MKKILPFIPIPILYWVIVVQISIYYYDEATFYFKLATISYSGNLQRGDSLYSVGKKYKLKAENTLSFLPKFLRP